jgi:hypothetical protein
VLYKLAAPAGNTRGPQYVVAALTALHRGFIGRMPLEFILGRQDGQVGLYTRVSPQLSPLVVGQLEAAYSDIRIESVTEDSFSPGAGEICTWARLRLMPKTASLISLERFIDLQERQIVDPLAGILAGLSSRKSEALRPAISFVVRPAGRWAQWRIRRQARNTEKLRGPLWVADVRLAVVSPATHRRAAAAKIHELAGLFGHFLPSGDNRFQLSRLRHGTMPTRISRRCRWFISPVELSLLWHAPINDVRTPQLRTNDFRELEPPPRSRLPTLTNNSQLAVLGRAAFRERNETFGILPEDRFRHLYTIGQTGTGKSTLLLNMAAADIAAERAVVLLDPHGDLCEQLLSIVAPRRTNDIILFDPNDPHSVSYNPLACRDKRQRPLVASAVVTSFHRLFGASWGPRLEHILRNCILTLLENEGTTLVSLQRLLSDDGYRKQLVGRLSDEVVRSFWFEEWEKWKPQFRAEAIAPVQNKVGALVTHPLLRNVLGDADARLDLRETIDSGKVLLCNLSKGRLGEDAATLLGSLLVAGVQLAAMSRADQPETERAPAYLFLDEFQNFLTSETIPTLLAEMRKYRLAVILAHQHLGQLDEATATAVFGNAGTLVAFRLGQDAELFAEQLGSELLPADLRSLPKYHAYVRLLIDGHPTRPFSMKTVAPPHASAERQEIVRRASRQRYGKPIRQVPPKLRSLQGVSRP